MPLPAAFRGLEPVLPDDHVPGAPRGASTTCWGPDMWMVLHGLAYHVADARLWSKLVALLGELLPCKFCRESWPAFVAQLEAASGKSVAEHVTAGTFPRFLYDAHNLVNDKLMRQRMKDAAAMLAPAMSVRLGMPPEAVADALCKAAEATPGAYAELDKRPSFECVTKRYFIAGEAPFACASLWKALLIFTVNFSADKGPVYIDLLRVLGACIAAMAGATHDIQAAGRALTQAADVLERRGKGEREGGEGLDQEDVRGVVALAQAACEGRALPTADARRAYLADVQKRVTVAAAGACLNGVCK